MARPRRRASAQQELRLNTWGGKRKRPRRLERSSTPHRARTPFHHRRALHVTLRMAPHVWSLRSRRSQAVVERVLRGGADRFETRIVQLSVMGDHIHLLVEAPDHVSLAKAMKGLSVRLGIHLNRLMKRHGRVMGDRYHARLLSTPTEVRHAAQYIRNNFKKHEAQRGVRVPAGFVDPYSSEGCFAPFVAPVTLWLIRKAVPS